MAGRQIDIKSDEGKAFRAYVALPEKGAGPGIVIAHEIFGLNHHTRAVADYYAREGYVAIAPDLLWRIQPGIELGYSEAEFKRAFEIFAAFDVDKAVADLGRTLGTLRATPECQGGAGIIGYCLGGLLAYLTAARHAPDVAVSYYGGGIADHLDEAKKVKCPIGFHHAGRDEFVSAQQVAKIKEAFKGNRRATFFYYPMSQHGFNNDERTISYDKAASRLALSHTLGVLRPAIGPDYNLEALWEHHLACEFATYSSHDTIASMTPDPYVNIVPTLTGGTGKQVLTRFYHNHFIPVNPKDAEMVQISRTVGPNRITEELIMSFAHNQEVDWLLPGIAPTGKRVDVPIAVVVDFVGEKIAGENIYWDQAGILAQIGLLDEDKLPIRNTADQAEKLIKKRGQENELLKRAGIWARSEPSAA